MASVIGVGTTVAADQGTSDSGPLQIGQSFGPRYRILKLLGAGGMGAVYQAWDAELSVAVALKVIRVDRRETISTDAERRFKQELLLARQVTHKHVVRIHDLGEIDGVKYITMPFIEGHDLATVLRRSGKLPIARVLALAREIAEGLQAAHEAGVVHRDLKPANVMIGADGHALLMDFGISASANDTPTGGVVGTLEYMAPEQSQAALTDGRADIYALGLMIYEMLTGPRNLMPTTVQERVGAMRERTTRGLPPLRTIDPSVPEPLAEVVNKCLALDPAARYRSAAEVLAALARLDDNGHLRPEPRRFSGRIIAASAVALLLLVVATSLVARRFATPRAPVQHEPVSVLISDFHNATGDPSFDETLEPMLKLALEGAGFINAYDRSGIRRSLGVRPPDTLDEQAAQAIAVKQGVGVVLAGAMDRQGNAYGISIKATQVVTGQVIASVNDRAATKADVLPTVTKLADKIRGALGDDTSGSNRRFASDTLSASSLEVVHEYAGAMDALSRSRFEEALQHFGKAVQLDPNFGLAYAGMAIASGNMDRQQDADKYIKEAIKHLDGMTERERYRTRGLYYFLTADYQACVKEYGDLIDRYSADAAARNNRALCLTHLRDMPKAIEEMRQVVKILPNRALYRENLALYSDYAGDFDGAVDAVHAMKEPGLFGTLARAYAQVGKGDIADAKKTFQSLASFDDQGASYAASGLGDLAIYEGRFNDAARILADGANKDLASKDADRAASKYAALAYAEVLRDRKPAAIAAADKALSLSQGVKIRFLAARVYVLAGAIAKARPLSAGLASELQAEPRAYAGVIDGDLALARGDARQAVASLTAANGILDTWIGHFDLGRAYLEAQAFPQADSEFDRSIKRRGEALALFLDEEPTYGYFPAVYYYQGRVREALGVGGFADAYRTYLGIRGKAAEDPLLPDVRRRAGQ